MNKISLYTLLILLFLGLSKSFSPSERGTLKITDERLFSYYFQGAPISLVLVNSFQTGFLIKTYFHKYKVIHGFKHPEEIIVRTTKDFWKKNENNLGMSLFRREEKKQIESYIPMPPGSLYIGDSSFGKWVLQDSGQRVWEFHRPYKHFTQIFGWKEFRPTKSFYKELLVHLKNNKPYYGLDNEFGLNGSISSHITQKELLTKEKLKNELKNYIEMLLYLPPWIES